MGMRFRRRINIFPGLTLNLSGSGVSATIGVPGANFNVSHRGVYGTAGIPGSGLHYRTSNFKFPEGEENAFRPAQDAPEFAPYNFQQVATEYKSSDGDMTSANLSGFKQMILDNRAQVSEAKANVAALEAELKAATYKRLLFNILSLGFLLSQKKAGIREEIEELEVNIAFETQLASSRGLKVYLSEGSDRTGAWSKLLDNYKGLMGAKRIWDVVTEQENDAEYRRAKRSVATQSLERICVSFQLCASPIFESDLELPRLENHNGGDITLYPGFLCITQGGEKFSLIDFRSVSMELSIVSFAEEEGVPEDSEVAFYVWAKANKDGSPDMRFKDNYQIPVCTYAELALTSSEGLNERYQFSNVSAAQNFAAAFERLKANFTEGVRFQIGDADENVSAPTFPSDRAGAVMPPEVADAIETAGDKKPNRSAPPNAPNPETEPPSMQIEEAKRNLVKLILDDAKQHFGDRVLDALSNLDENFVLDQMVRQCPDPEDISTLESITFDIPVSYVDEDGDHRDGFSFTPQL